jgi:hypothetical protein
MFGASTEVLPQARGDQDATLCEHVNHCTAMYSISQPFRDSTVLSTSAEVPQCPKAHEHPRCGLQLETRPRYQSLRPDRRRKSPSTPIIWSPLPTIVSLRCTWLPAPHTQLQFNLHSTDVPVPSPGLQYAVRVSPSTSCVPGERPIRSYLLPRDCGTSSRI